MAKNAISMALQASIDLHLSVFGMKETLVAISMELEVPDVEKISTDTWVTQKGPRKAWADLTDDDDE
jgi:hypothetical protein